MANTDKTQAEKIVAEQKPVPSKLSGKKAELNDVLTRRLKAVQSANLDGNAKIQRAIDRLAANIIAQKGNK